VFDAITRFSWPKNHYDSKLYLGDGGNTMVLTPGYIKVVATEIGSQIIEELRKSSTSKKSSAGTKSTWVCEAAYNDKGTLVGYFKYYERRGSKETENERTNE
jgi:hypothetical protein